MIWAIMEDFFLDYQPNLNIRDLKNNLGNLQIIQYEPQRVEFSFWKCVISLSQKKIMAQFHVDLTLWRNWFQIDCDKIKEIEDNKIKNNESKYQRLESKKFEIFAMAIFP